MGEKGNDPAGAGATTGQTAQGQGQGSARRQIDERSPGVAVGATDAPPDPGATIAGPNVSQQYTPADSGGTPPSPPPQGGDGENYPEGSFGDALEDAIEQAQQDQKNQDPGAQPLDPQPKKKKP